MAYCVVIVVVTSTERCCGDVLLAPDNEAGELGLFARRDALVAHADIRLMVVIVALVVFVVAAFLELVVVVCHMRDLAARSSIAALAMERSP